MCGIAGALAPAGIDPGLLGHMSALLRHRGPDDEGYVGQRSGEAFVPYRGEETIDELSSLPAWSSAPDGYQLAMCHRRLSIIDLTSAGHQPMLSPDGNLALVYNGEIYNYLELADELGSLGWDVRGQGDTAVLLAAFAQWGPACVHRLRGMWAFAVYDRRTATLTLSRDRFGIKPLYYMQHRGSFAFASEMKALLAALSSEPRGSATDVVRLLAWGALDDEESTLFEDISAVPAGTNLHLDARDLRVRSERYYDVTTTAVGEFRGSLADAVDEYRLRLDESIRLHMRSDVQVGSCLSGGLDSNLAVALATRRLGNGRLATFTAVFDDPAIDERRFVELHAARSGRFVVHQATPTAESLLAELDRFVHAQEHPVASSAPFAQWAVMQLAGTQKIKVLLDGQGADEAIGGYSYFAGAYLLDLARAGRLLSAYRQARLLRDRRSVHLGRELGRAAYANAPAAIRRRVRAASRTGLDLVTPEYRFLAGDPPATSARTFTDRCAHAVAHSLPRLLRYEDRSSMAFSIESRVPYLDHPLVEFVLSLPPGLKFHQGWSKFVQRRAADDLLPSEIVWRKDKLGFTTPQGEWKRALAGRLRELIRSTELPPFLDRTRIEKMLESETASSVALSEFWQTMFLLKWLDVFRVQFVR